MSVETSPATTIRGTAEADVDARRRVEAPPVAPTPAGRPSGKVAALTPKLWLGVADVTCIVVSMFAAAALRTYGPDPEPLFMYKGNYVLVGLASLPIWVAAFMRRRLYTARYVSRPIEEFRRIVNGVTVGLVGTAAVSFMLQQEDLSRAWVLATWVFAVSLVSLERSLARLLFARLRRRGSFRRSVVIVGWNAEGRQLAEMLRTDPALGYDVLGFVDRRRARREDTPEEHEEEVVGSFAETIDLVRRTGASGVLVAATGTDIDLGNDLVRDMIDAGVHVEITSSLRDIDVERLTVSTLGRFPVVYVEPVRRTGWRSAAKRLFDLVLSSVVLLLTLPIWLAAAVAIKLDTPGPVLFSQERVGKDGNRFRVLKFRTMCTDAQERMAALRQHNEAAGPLFKMKDDPRVTRVGRLLRKLSVDELPQLVNVFRNEMSLIGPRPAIPSEVDEWELRLHGRLRVKPGITGMWQVNGRADASFETYSRLDLYYVENWSLLTDLAILAKTVPTVLLRRGAY